MVEQLGKIHPSKTLFLRETVGEATDNKTGVKYEMTNGVGGGGPIVRSSKTGKWFTLSWSEIINLAKKAGIDGKKS